MGAALSHPVARVRGSSSHGVNVPEVSGTEITFSLADMASNTLWKFGESYRATHSTAQILLPTAEPLFLLLCPLHSSLDYMHS